MPKKPTLKKGPAALHEAPNEIIREFSINDGKATGGLLALRTMDDGTLLVDVYQVDEAVKVNVPTENINALNGTTLVSLTPAELDYLALAVDLGRSDPETSAHLTPSQRDDLLLKLGGRRTS